MDHNFIYFMGIDPGKNGAIAIIDNNLNIKFLASFSGCFRKDNLVWSKYKEWTKIFNQNIEKLGSENIFCLVEDVHSMPKQGVSSSFSFGYYTGLISAYAMAVPGYWEVAPNYWKKRMGLNTNKKLSIGMAKELFGALNGKDIDDGEAEALLIAYFAKEEEVYRYLHDKEAKNYQYLKQKGKKNAHK